MQFDPVNPKQPLPDIEHGILQYWKEEDVFKRSLNQRKQQEDETGNKDNTYSFYDGPPFATGLPHYGHLLAGTIKDVIPRYQTMRGHFVQRRFGWDCHGLPIENLIEQENDITDHKAITDEIGVGNFCEMCRDAVQRYTGEWRQVVERMGRWVDMDWDYRTMDPDYMESMWWAFSELFSHNLIYEGHKSMHICTRCVTALSNFEVTQGYTDRTDLSVYMTFPLKDDPDTILLAWTTTPWSLPGNIWLLVGPTIDYVKVHNKEDSKTYILAAPLVEKVFKNIEHAIVEHITAKDLVGLRYEPLFDAFVDKVLPSTENSDKPETYGERCFEVLLDEHGDVSDQDGTGIVHITNSHGEDGFQLAQKLGVDILHHVQMDGSFVPELDFLKGHKVKPEGEDPMSTDKLVIAKLKEMGRHFSSNTFTHSYPHCWRCDTPLLNYACSSWFVRISEIKKQMLANKDTTSWVPSHLKDGRYGNWLENARDWAISRNRFWGTPLPIWRSPQGDIETVRSRDELMLRDRIRFTKLSILRHGESVGNTIPKYQGIPPGTDLTDAGKSQAHAAGKRLQTSEPRVDIIYCSPLARCKQTAEEIAKETGAEIIIDERLKEVQFGQYEGKTIDFTDMAFLKAKRAHKLQNNSAESIYHFEGMETWKKVYSRIENFLEETLPLHRSEHVVIVTHADPIQSFKHYFTKQDPIHISHQPYPEYATESVFYWDHKNKVEMDLHKHRVDDIVWPGSACEQSVELTAVRHGQTPVNKEGRTYKDTEDPPLTKDGEAQALATAQSLSGQEFDVIVHSQAARATQTAAIIAKELGIQSIEQMDGIQERKQGVWGGQKLQDIINKNPTVYDEPSTTLHHMTPKGGESLTELLVRAQETQAALLKKFPGKKILLVGHRGHIRAMNIIVNNLGHKEALHLQMHNADALQLTLNPLITRIPEVLDCWFESGSMPFAQANFPFANPDAELPPGFPANFIAEGIDQCRAWFYVLMVLSTALFGKSPFQNVVVNGIVLAEDGKKMSKRLKNYPEPTEIMEKYGADAIRFTLMNSPAVRGEDLRMSEALVEASMRSVLLPLWNTYAFFVTYANAAQFNAITTRAPSKHPLDMWIKAEIQDLINRMTHQLDNYDLSATCTELFDTIDAITNWYVRLSRRRFAGKGQGSDSATETAHVSTSKEEQLDALHTLYDVLLSLSQVLAPFCPFVTDAMYINLVRDPHTSVHLTDWPETRDLTDLELSLLTKTRVMRTAVKLGLSVRGEAGIKNRQPLESATIAIPPSIVQEVSIGDDDLAVLQQELNVHTISFADHPEDLAESFVQVDARKVGPRMGKRVQEIIQAGKNGDFTIKEDGTVHILDEVLNADEAKLVYRGKKGQDVAADAGIVVSLNTELTKALELEGDARDVIRAIQRQRKDSGFEFTDFVQVQLEGADDILAVHGDLIASETNSIFKKNKGKKQEIEISGRKVRIALEK